MRSPAGSDGGVVMGAILPFIAKSMRSETNSQREVAWAGPLVIWGVVEVWITYFALFQFRWADGACT